MLKRISNFFRIYMPFFKARAMDFMAYKFQVLTWAFITALQVVCVVCLWVCLYSNVPSGELVNGYSFHQMIVYLVFSNIYSFVTLNNSTFDSLYEDISQGTIGMSFTKPISYRIKFIFGSLGDVFICTLVLGLPLFIASYIIFFFIGFISISNIGLFLISILLFFIMEILSVIVLDGINYFFGLLCFYTEAAWGVGMLLSVITSFLSGVSIPLSFFGAFGKVLSFSPFAGLTSNPIRTLLMFDSFNTSLMNIGISLVWIVVIEIINCLFFKRASKKVTVMGG